MNMNNNFAYLVYIVFVKLIIKHGWTLDFKLTVMSTCVSIGHSKSLMLTDHIYVQGRRHGGGGKGAKAPLKISKKGKIKKYGVFSCIKVIKMSFSVIFNEEIRALEGLLSRF